MFDQSVAPAADDRATVIQRVRLKALEECPPEMPWAPWLDRCVDDAVDQLWDSPIKTFVPLLALRHVRCCIRAGSCDCGTC